MPHKKSCQIQKFRVPCFVYKSDPFRYNLYHKRLFSILTFFPSKISFAYWIKKNVSIVLICFSHFNGSPSNLISGCHFLIWMEYEYLKLQSQNEPGLINTKHNRCILKESFPLCFEQICQIWQNLSEVFFLKKSA